MPGVPLARIHWPALARGAGLQVRRFSAASGALPLVVVDTSGARDVRAVDWAVRTAAGHILALTRRGGCRVLLPGDAAATAVLELDGGWRALLRRLAMVDPAGPAPRLADEAPTLWVRASAAPARVVGAVPPALPRGVVAVVSEASAG